MAEQTAQTARMLSLEELEADIIPYEPLSKLLVSPLITPIVVPYIIPYTTRLRSSDYSSYEKVDCLHRAFIAVPYQPQPKH